MTGLEVRPITFRQAKTWIAQHHRHSSPPYRWKFGAALYLAGHMVGVGTACTPTARKQDDGFTLEITRVCTNGVPNGCSKLYAALLRAGKALGFRRAITYTRIDETGSSLKAAGFTVSHRVKAASWNVPSRPRVDLDERVDRLCWERVL